MRQVKEIFEMCFGRSLRGYLAIRRALPSVRQTQKFTRSIGVFFLLCATTFYSFGGLDLYLGFKTPFAPQIAGAA